MMKLWECQKINFKTLLKRKISSTSLSQLNEIAQKHSKSQNLVKTNLKCEPYICDNRFSAEEVQLLFQLRTRMYPVKANFKNHYKDEKLLCKFCAFGISDQQHQLECVVLTKFIPELSCTTVEYADIFGSVDDQLAAIKLFVEITNQRNILLEALSK